jgi:hypothetical protein
MPAPALLLRCLLIVTLCLDGSVSVWAASVTAVNKAQLAIAAAGAVPTTALADTESDCEDGDATTSRHPQSHDDGDCDCGIGTCGCMCIFSVAAISHSVPFMAQHALASPPAVRSTPHAPLDMRTPVFRPPIG